VSDEPFGRRLFLQKLSFFGGGVLLFGPACNSEGKPVPPPSKIDPAAIKRLGESTTHHTFTNEDFDVMAAAVDRIIPRDQDPGAIDANVPEYVDRTLQTPELHQMKEDFQDGIDLLQKRAHGTFGKDFTALSDDQRDQLLHELMSATKGSGEQSFFQNLLVLTLEGFLGDPAYGGNKDKIGWKLVGFGTWVPPHYQPDQGLVRVKYGEEKGG
jgi:gluconate 2-dehydrogenase gamma chain